MNERRRESESPMSLPLETLFAVAKDELAERKSRGKPKRSVSVPDVDPEGSGLDDLFAWGDAVAERAQLTPERTKEILALAHKIVKDRS